MLHSDGHVTPLIPHFLAAGFAALHPLEVKAGLDVADLKARYGEQLVLFGNIDARALSGTRAEIEAEIAAKIPAAMERGGYIYHSDHSVPSSVSFENYAFAIELVKKYGAY
jgi:uroporphyrinogen decarboxylase